jgi:hypothetical protein
MWALFGAHGVKPRPPCRRIDAELRVMYAQQMDAITKALAQHDLSAAIRRVEWPQVDIEDTCRILWDVVRPIVHRLQTMTIELNNGMSAYGERRYRRRSGNPVV